MKTFSKYILIMSIAVVFTTCSTKNSNESLQKYSEMPKEKRLSFIHSILVEKNVITFENEKQRVLLEILAPYNYCYQAIDHIILKKSGYTLFSKSDSSDNFQHVLGWLIPTLFYSYSPKNFYEVSNDYREKATQYVLNHSEYYYSFGEDKFRSILRQWLDKRDYKDTLLFNYFTQNGDRDSYADGKLDVKKYYNYLNTVVWYDEFKLSDFEHLSQSEQKLLLSQLILHSISQENVKSKKLYYSEIEKTCGISEYWESNQELVMKFPKIVSMDRNTTIETFTKAIIKEIQIKNNWLVG